MVVPEELVRVYFERFERNDESRPQEPEHSMHDCDSRYYFPVYSHVYSQHMLCTTGRRCAVIRVWLRGNVGRFRVLETGA